ncbi:MAG TPA: FHA domain-containing protein [Thermoguttaceae bacterium]|nr:FHA domain-containing protein [Thermoguttaceae bacterium]
MVGIAASSILDVADQEFVLRVCGSPRHGQIVRLRSPKCTIGSGPRCTLRLRARGVQPVHCLVLRGAAGTVIRRFAADTRLNGRAFRDAKLVPGDRLSVGPVEFEVLDADQVPDHEPPIPPIPPIPAPTPRPAEAPEREDLGARLASANRLGRARARRLLRELRSARQQIAELEKQPVTDRTRDPEQQRGVEGQTERLDHRLRELDALASRLSHREHSLQQKQEAVDEQQRTLREQQALAEQAEAHHEEQEALGDRRTLREQQRALDEQRQALDREQQALHERSEQLDRAQADLKSQRNVFDEERRRWDTDRAALQVDSGRQVEEVEARLAELQAQREALQQDRTRWENERAEAKEQLDKRAEQADAQRRALDAQRQEIQHARDRRTAEQDEARNKLEAESAELEQRRAELDAREAKSGQRRAELDARQADLDSRQTDLDTRQAEFDNRRAELDDRRAELDSRHADLDSRHADSESRHAELEARQAEMDARQAELDERHGELDARRAELDDRRAALDARESEIDEECRRWEAARAAADIGPGQPSGEADQEEDLPFEEPSQGSPESSDEVLRRMGIARSFHDEVEEDEKEEGQSPDASETIQRAPETPASPRLSVEKEDESIDDYMARLLDRVRAGTGRPGEPRASVPSVPAAPASAPSALPAPEATDSPPQAPAPKTREKGEFLPRAVASVKSVNLSAMRDLANLSARAAINRHARSRLLGRAANKLLVTIVALATGTILLWIWWAKTHDQVTLYAAVASLVVALVWLGQYVLLGGYALLNRPGRSKEDKKGDEEEADTGQQAE